MQLSPILEETKSETLPSDSSSSSDNPFDENTDNASNGSETVSDNYSLILTFDENDIEYTDEELKNRTFNKIELELMNRNNFERLFMLRGAREFAAHKGPEYLANIVLIQQRRREHGYKSGSSLDSRGYSDSSDNDSDENNLPNNLSYDELKKLKVVQLKNHLREKGLIVSGNKNQLITRLLENFNASNENNNEPYECYADNGETNNAENNHSNESVNNSTANREGQEDTESQNHTEQENNPE